MNERVYRSIQSLATVQKVEFHDENILDNSSLALFDELTSSTSRSTSSDQVVNDDNASTGLNSALLNLKNILHYPKSNEYHNSAAALYRYAHMIISLTSPYSLAYTALAHSPGSFPAFLTGANAAPKRRAIRGPKRKPRASKPTPTPC